MQVSTIRPELWCLGGGASSSRNNSRKMEPDREETGETRLLRERSGVPQPCQDAASASCSSVWKTCFYLLTKPCALNRLQ